VNPIHLAAISVSSSLAAAVSFAIDGPTIGAVVAAAVTMGGAVAKVWRTSVSAAARAQTLEQRVVEQGRQIDELKSLVNKQADIIATLTQYQEP
jgi:TolA-binding protein